jgi:Zn-dependent M28 family amino/carboxypeptidase
VDAADIAGAQMVFVGNGYVINKTNANPYQGLDVRGKVLVVAGVPPEMAAAQAAAAAARGAGAGAGAAAAGGRGGGRGANPLGVENTDFVTPQGYAAKNGAVGVIMIPTFQQLATMATQVVGRGVGPNGPSYQVVKFQAARAASVPTITAGIALTNAIFQGEKLSGAQVFEGATANAKLESFALGADKKLALHAAVTVDRNHTENVIAMLEGSDPVLKNEYIVISGHLDHLGVSAPDANGDSVFNGADDDGSGSAAIMAIARAYAQGAAKGIRPKRTMIFLWVAGEEKGLWGSQYFNQFPPIDITKVVADLNMDMIGRTKPNAAYVDPPSYKLCEPGEIMVVGPNISSDDLEKTLETVNAGYQKMKINHFYDVTAPDATHDNLGPGAQGQRIFYRSDHYNFAKSGIPIAFFTTGIHPDYHRLTDSPEKLDYLEMEKVTKTVSAVGWVLANSSAKPKINAKLPDQLINDMKTAKDQGWGKLTPVLPPLPGMPF